MKIKVSTKQIRECYIAVYNVCYCGIHNIENYLSQVMYTSNSNGWCSDIYDCGNGYAISTGYRTCGNKNLDRDIYIKYNKRFARLKNKTSVKAIQYLQDMIQEQKQRDKQGLKNDKRKI